MRRARLVVVLAALATWLPGLARAADPCATSVGTVAGTVTDSAAAPLPGAHVRVQGCLGDPVLAGADGSFVLPVPTGAQVIAAAADGHYIGCWRGGGADCMAVAAGATGLTIVLDALPAGDDPAYVFRTPETCQPCHPAVYEQWSRSTKAHTNRNLWVDNLYNGTALRDASDLARPQGPARNPNDPPYFSFLKSHNPDHADQPTRNGECANCHQPEYVGTDPSNTSFNAYSAPEQHAVTCDFCHKVVDVDVSVEGIRRPNLVVGTLGLPAKTTMLRASAAPWLVFGPLDDATFSVVPDMRASHASVIRSSRLCAACHEDHADPRGPGDVFLETYKGPPSQTTYSEWAASDYPGRGIECQDCHMPSTGADHFCERTSNHRDPSQVRSHIFEGTTPDFLRRAVTLKTRAAVSGDTLAVDVDLTNSGAGHAFPTGVTLRNAILVVLATDRDGTALQQLAAAKEGGPRVPDWGGVGSGGSADPATGRLAGLPGRGYARVLADENQAENVLFTEAVRAYDNRIPAGTTDQTHYRFQLPKGWQQKDVRVDTRLYYRRAFKPTADQRRWNVPLGANAHGTRGDGSDYDENEIVVSARRFLTCRGRVTRFTGSGRAGAGTLALQGMLKLPRRTAIDAAANGVRVTLASLATAVPVVEDDVTGFSRDGQVLVHVGAEAEPVRLARLSGAGRRLVRVALDLGGLDPVLLGEQKLLLGLDSGEVCFRKTLRCKSVGGAVRCR